MAYLTALDVSWSVCCALICSPLSCICTFYLLLVPMSITKCFRYISTMAIWVIWTFSTSVVRAVVHRMTDGAYFVTRMLSMRSDDALLLHCIGHGHTDVDEKGTRNARKNSERRAECSGSLITRGDMQVGEGKDACDCVACMLNDIGNVPHDIWNWRGIPRALHGQENANASAMCSAIRRPCLGCSLYAVALYASERAL